MWLGYLIAALAGVVGANGVPHYVKGSVGRTHQTPFGKPSSAVLNAIWGTVNLAGALWLAVWAATYHLDPGPAGTCALLGALLIGAPLAHHWAKDPTARGEQT